jgi:signal transduction histidine kinase
VDEDLLHQALVNLLMNAIEATPTGGRILVSARQAGDEWELTIADTGRGIPAKDLDHIFKPFFTTRHTGTGLGLPITRDIVERHGGHLTLDSTLGSGTTATIHLPLHASVAHSGAADLKVGSP